MYKKLLFFLFLVLMGCRSLVIPDDFLYKEIDAGGFTLASWQKVSSPNGVYKIYIEGDGAAFDAYGRPTSNPTPRGTLLREIAFQDYNPNVVYLARPCQFVKRGICSKRHWTTARFAPEVIRAMGDEIKAIAGNNEVVLVGFSGGAQVAGLIATNRKDLNIKKMITIAGNLDHLSWVQYHNLPPLDESMNLVDYKREYLLFNQKHFVGDKDTVIVPELVFDFIQDSSKVEIVSGATHSSGWDKIYPRIWREK